MLVQIRSSRKAVLPYKRVEQPVRALVDANARRVEYVRLSLTDRCNYRCTYCMPDEVISYGDRDDVLNFDDIVRLMHLFLRAGVTTVRLTGGEPTVRRDLPLLVQRIADLRGLQGERLKIVLTTNGELLSGLVSELVDAGLSGLTVSLDSLREDRFRRITRRGVLARVLDGIAKAASVPGFRVKLNTVAISGFNDDELHEICEYAWSLGILPRFIEMMPMSQGRLYAPGKLMSAQEIRHTLGQRFQSPVSAQPAVMGQGLGPATYWRTFSNDRPSDFGIIAAMTENFCSSCNRVRVSATGQLHACLANDDERDLKRFLRTGDESGLEQAIRAALGQKRESHRFELDGTGGPTKNMISIGG